MTYKYISFLLFIIGMSALVPAAHAQSALKKANSHFESYEYALAIAQYQASIEKQKPSLQTTQRLAEAYRLTRRTKEAENWYAKVVAMEGFEPINLYHYAEMLRSNGKYSEAKAQYLRWAEEEPAMEERARALARATETGQRWMQQRPMAEVKKEERISVANYSDFSPMPFGSGIMLSSDRGTGATSNTEVFGWTGRPYLQLFTATKDNQGNWGAPVALQNVINSGYHNATAASDEEGQKIYFTRVHVGDKRGKDNPLDPTSWINKSTKKKDLVNRLEIFVAKKQGGSWTDIEPFAYNKVEEYSVGHPALSPDGQILYFASDMPGGLGETDIYYCKLNADRTWGAPVNAGSKINTAGRESFPSVDKNGKLFFASEGHMGMGGLDIFAAEGNQGAWSGVKNLGYPVNSPQNDFGIMFDKANESGLLSSNRDAADGTDDIYSFTMLQKPVVFAITTVAQQASTQGNAKQVALPEVRIAMVQQNQNDTTVISTNSQGKKYINGLSGNTYSFLVSRAGYRKQSVIEQVPSSVGDTLQVLLALEGVAPGTTGNSSTPGVNENPNALVLNNIYFAVDKAWIGPNAAAELDKIAEILKGDESIRLEIGAHADSRYTKKYNQQLSERRASAAAAYLVSKGISRNRITAKGYGKTRLVNHCTTGVKCSRAEHLQNRRAEFRIINS